MKKIMVYIFSVYPDFSFDNKKSEKITEISFHNRNNRNHVVVMARILCILKNVNANFLENHRKVFEGTYPKVQNQYQTILNTFDLPALL